MSKVGPVEGGAETIIKALLAVAGDGTTVVMPAYPMPSTMYEWMNDPTPFDLRTSPSRMGIITEVFRKMPGVARSAHPSHSVAAYGPRATMYTGDHHKVTKSCGPGFPFRVLTDSGGDILCLGTGVGKITNYHVVEDYLDDFPLSVYIDMRMSKEVIFEDGHSERVEITVGNSRMSPWRVDNFKPKEMEYFRHLKSYGVVKEALVGRAKAHLIDGEGFHRMMVDLVRKGITIYHQPKLGFLSTIL
jgi:aminoglycoside 3-N-acetyltransferase